MVRMRVMELGWGGDYSYMILLRVKFPVSHAFLLISFKLFFQKKIFQSRKKHHFILNGDNTLISRISVVDFPVSNLIEDSPASINIEEAIPQKFYGCRYENDWYFGIANYVSIENSVNVKFMHPKGPASKFFWPSRDDVCWVPAENLICEVNPPDASTTRRLYVFQVNF